MVDYVQLIGFYLVLGVALYCLGRWLGEKARKKEGAQKLIERIEGTWQKKG
jgi:hypothetical protein